MNDLLKQIIADIEINMKVLKISLEKQHAYDDLYRYGVDNGKYIALRRIRNKLKKR